MTNQPYAIDAGVAARIGHYADAVRVPAGFDQILVSGTPGLRSDGSLPDGVEAQARQAWTNVASILEKAGASLGDIVSIRQWLINDADIAAYVPVRSEFVTHLSASMLAVIPALVRPEFLVEIEVIAAVSPTAP